MTSKLAHFRVLAEQLPQKDEEILDWEWHSFMHFQSELVKQEILKHRPPTSNHLRELTRLALGQAMKAPRSVEARWAKRTATKLSQEAIVVTASNMHSPTKGVAA